MTPRAKRVGRGGGSHAHSLLTRPLSVHPVRPRLHSAISNGSPFAGYRKASPSLLIRDHSTRQSLGARHAIFSHHESLRNTELFTNPYHSALADQGNKDGEEYCVTNPKSDQPLPLRRLSMSSMVSDFVTCTPTVSHDFKNQRIYSS